MLLRKNYYNFLNTKCFKIILLLASDYVNHPPQNSILLWYIKKKNYYHNVVFIVVINHVLLILVSSSGLLCFFSSVAGASATNTISITEEKATKQEGSRVTINCKYKFQDEMTLLWIRDPKWNQKEKRFDGTIVYSNTEERPQASEYSGRVEFVNENIDEKQEFSTCTLKINNLKKTDSGNYAFRLLKGSHKYKSLNEFKLTVSGES